MLFGPHLNPFRGRGGWLLASSCSQTAGPFLSESQAHGHHPRVCRRRENAMQVHSRAIQCKAVQCNAEPISAAQGKALQGRERHGTARQTRLSGFPRWETQSPEPHGRYRALPPRQQSGHGALAQPAPPPRDPRAAPPHANQAGRRRPIARRPRPLYL